MTILLNIMRQSPEKIAMAEKGYQVSYGELENLIQIRAKKIKKYRCVALAMDNQIEWVLWDLASLASNTTLVPLPPFFTKEQRDHAVKSSGCDAIITSDGLIPLEYAPVALPNGTAKITYTSGTTGTPKGVCLSSQSFESVAKSIVDVLGDDTAMIHMPILPFGVLLENVAGVYTTLMAGGTVFINRLETFGKNYENLHDIIKESSATSLILVPEILRLLMAQILEKGALQSLNYVAVGGSKVSSSLITQAQGLGIPVYEGYGLSECGSVVSLNTPTNNKIGSVGRLLPHIRADIENDEIVIINTGFLGYVGEVAPKKVYTGDLGNIDENGFLNITGRKKNILITSYGRNISPEWVESELLSQPEISQTIVYGDGESYLSAFVVPSSTNAKIKDGIDRANICLPDYAQIKKFTPVPPFTQNDGTLTGTGRPRRSRIFHLYQTEKNHVFL